MSVLFSPREFELTWFFSSELTRFFSSDSYFRAEVRPVSVLTPASVRLDARAGRAQPGARDGWVHRQGDPAMRTTGTPAGRGGRPPRPDQGVVRHGDRRGKPNSSRRAGRAARAPFLPATREVMDA